MEQAKAVPITERLRAIKIGNYTVDNGSHSKHFAVRAVCEEAAAEIERANEHERQLKGECLLLADVLRNAYEVIKTIEGEDTDESDKLTEVRLSIAHALALYDERKLYEEYAMVEALGERRFARGERAWWVPKNAVRPDHDAQIAVTVLRTGKVWATVIVAMNGSGHWYTQRARLDDMRLRTEYLAVDVIADKGLECLP